MSRDEAAHQCYDEEYVTKCISLSNELFGRQLTCSELAELVGAFADAQIRVRCGIHYIRLNHQGYTRVDGVMIVVTHEFYRVPQKRIIFREDNGALVLFNERFEVDEDVAPPYTGTRVLARSVKELLRYNRNTEARYRIRKMRTHAFSASDAYNGAYTWARLGYDARLDRISPNLKEKLLKEALAAEYSDQLRQAMEGVETLNDLILVGGAELWRKTHEEFWGDFDLSPDSDSVNILFIYVEKKGIEL